MAQVIIFEDINFQGKLKQVSTDTALLEDFNDVTSSFAVLEGNWQFFNKANFDDFVTTLGPGVYPNVEAVGIPNDAISSLRPVKPLHT